MRHNDAPEAHAERQLSEPESAPIECEVVIVGAGPCGLFQIFELGLLGMRAHIVDSLAHPGGQCTELYPDKPIYDIPALPVCGAQELIDRLMQQIQPFGAQFHLGQEVTEVRKQADGVFFVRTSRGTSFHTRTLVIAGGVGSFQPRRLGVEGAEAYEGSQIHYRVRNAAALHDQDLLIFGGGDSALDWVIELCGKARSLTLVHRRADFRAAPASVARMRELVAAGKMRYVEGIARSLIVSGERLTGVRVHGTDGTDHELGAGQVLAFFGLHPKLGPIAQWGLDLDKRTIRVDTARFETSIPGIFAIGDINTYPGKKKLILSGFHEAALAAFAIQHHIYPEKKQLLQYTTTSPIMHKRLGVTGQ
ncbi:MAG: NAD(P)/FAD-dependent oxidoreductase [Gammaproteobacteria bacterium]|nr:NAD(P)/FAD-dependent oxidoreductase [Gammaproteobacteria bacterium]